MVVCQNNAAARAVCEHLFVPGTWTVGGMHGTVKLSLARGGAVVARGTGYATKGKLVRARFTAAHRLAAGSYRLTVAFGHTTVSKTVRIG
jgi:hypothetical protein